MNTAANAPSVELTGPLETARLALARIHLGADGTLRAALLENAALVARALDIERVSIWLFDSDRSAIRCFHLFHRASAEVMQGTMLRRHDFPNYFAALEAARVIPIGTAQAPNLAQEFHAPYLQPLGITAMLDAPIYRAGLVAGVVCHEHIGTPRQWTPGEELFAITVADTLTRLFEEAGRLKAETSLAAYEERFAQVQRLEALGRLAGGVAHDFRNILTVLLGHAELLALRTDLPPDAAESIREIHATAARGRDIAGELLTYGRATSYHPQVIEIGTVITGMKTMLASSIAPAVNLDLDCDAHTHRVFMDRSQLERVVLNLVTNASQAMPHGGRLTIRVAEHLIPATDGTREPYVALTVSDTGLGMDEQTRRHMCDPFFTTRGDKGTGLGLAIVNQIIHRSGGLIEVETELGRGTTIRCCLPPIAPRA